LTEIKNHIGSSFNNQRVLIKLDFMGPRVLNEVRQKQLQH